MLDKKLNLLPKNQNGVENEKIINLIWFGFENCKVYVSGWEVTVLFIVQLVVDSDESGWN